MKKYDKFINAYEISYLEMLNSNIASYRPGNKNTKKASFEKNTFKNKNDNFNPTSWID